MRILFDENVPHPLRRFLPDDDVATVQELGWSGVENGELVARAGAGFDVLVVADKNLRYQQNLTGRRVAIVELPTNRWPVVTAIAEKIATAVHHAKPGDYVAVEID